MKKILSRNIKLNNGLEMPIFGLGTYRMSEPEETKNAIIHAINYGYKALDSADYYKNHQIINKAIKESKIKREDLFITTKIWPENSNKEKVIEDVKRFLVELDIKYLDLVLIHWPSPTSTDCYKGLEECVKLGLVKSIGVSNYQEKHLEELLKVVEIKPVINQVELHPKLSLVDLRKVCDKHGIIVTSWQTLLSGKVGDIKEIVEIGKKYKATPAQVALKWAVQQNIIVIPKSVTPSRIEENANIEFFNLTEQEINDINNLGPETRLGPDPEVLLFKK